jgi:hypothetical protein
MILMMPNNSILTLSFKIICIYIYTSYNIYIYTLYCLFVSRVFRVFYPVERDEASIPGRESPSRLSCSAVPATELGGDRSMLQDTQIYIYISVAVSTKFFRKTVSRVQT